MGRRAYEEHSGLTGGAACCRDGCGVAGHAVRRGGVQQVRLGVGQQVMLPGGVRCSRSCCQEGCGAAGHAANRRVVQQVMLPGRDGTAGHTASRGEVTLPEGGGAAGHAARRGTI